VSASNLVITALKKAEDDDHVVVRLVDMEGKDSEATVRLSFPVQAAEHTNMIEEDGTAVAVKDGALPVQVGHHAIETYKVTVG
jgi:alpha-mannosidase